MEHLPKASPGSKRFGPATAPMVVDQNTIDKSRPRVLAAARSVAAKRAWRLTAVPAPSRASPSSLDFANSAVVLPGGQSFDLLAAPADATKWLVEHQLAPADALLQEICAVRLRDMRDQLRALLAAQIQQTEPPATAITAVNQALRSVPTASLLRWEQGRGLYRASSHPATQVVEHALAALASDAADLLAGEDARQLDACASPPCNRYFLRTHARRHWCSTRCGDRVRAVRAYARRSETEAMAG